MKLEMTEGKKEIKTGTLLKSTKIIRKPNFNDTSKNSSETTKAD